METILKGISWAVVTACFLAVPVAAGLLLGRKGRIRRGLLAGVLCALLVFAAAAGLAAHPVRVCPAELTPYMTGARWQEIEALTGRVYNPHIPCIPAIITIEQADTDGYYWKVNWFPFGTTRCGVTADGVDPVHGFGG